MYTLLFTPETGTINQLIIIIERLVNVVKEGIRRVVGNLRQAFDYKRKNPENK